MKPIAAITKVDQVRQAILELIFSGTLLPGQRLVEARLAHELGVAQATINLALQILDDQGIVTKILNRSTNVSRYTASEIENLFSVRLILEPAAAAAASRKLTREGREALERHVDGMKRAAVAADLPRFCLADYNFHQELYRMTENPVLVQACQAIAVAPFAYILCGTPSALPTDYASLAEDHQQVIDALCAGPETAERTVRARIADWRLHSVRVLESIDENEKTYACL